MNLARPARPAGSSIGGGSVGGPSQSMLGARLKVGGLTGGSNAAAAESIPTDEDDGEGLE